MILKNFLKLYGGESIVTIVQRPQNDRNKFAKTYFDEENFYDILESEVYKEVKDKKVAVFHVVGGDMYPSELFIELEEEEA